MAEQKTREEAIRAAAQVLADAAVRIARDELEAES